MLPEGSDASEFIEECEDLLDQEVNFRARIRLIEVDFQKRIEGLYKQANIINQALVVEHFNEIKQSLLALSASYKEMGNEINEKLKSLNKRVEQISQELIFKTETTQELGRRSAAQQQNQKRLLGQAHQLLEKI